MRLLDHFDYALRPEMDPKVIAEKKEKKKEKKRQEKREKERKERHRAKDESKENAVSTALIDYEAYYLPSTIYPAFIPNSSISTPSFKKTLSFFDLQSTVNCQGFKCGNLRHSCCLQRNSLPPCSCCCFDILLPFPHPPKIISTLKGTLPLVSRV